MEGESISPFLSGCSHVLDNPRSWVDFSSEARGFEPPLLFFFLPTGMDRQSGQGSRLSEQGIYYSLDLHSATSQVLEPTPILP